VKGLARTAILSLVGLALFSVVFSLAAAHGRWPQLPPGALHNTDLWVGLGGGAALLLLLLFSGERLTGGHGDGKTAGTERQHEASDPADEIAPSPALPISRSETEATIGADVGARAKRYSG
jgi:hypothetical protein